jgi:hypothetical protein
MGVGTRGMALECSDEKTRRRGETCGLAFTRDKTRQP